MITPALPGSSTKFRFADLRKIALTTFIASLLVVLIPLWNAMQTLLAIESAHPLMKWGIAPISLFVFFLSAIMPAFYFALSRNDGALRIPKRLRLLSMAVALTSGIMVVGGLPGWIRSIGPYWKAMGALDWRTGGRSAVTFVLDPRTIRQLSTVLSEFFSVAYILLLIAIFHQTSEHLETDLPASKLLRSTTRVAVIAWGVVVVLAFAGLVLTPLTFSQIRNQAVEVGRGHPAFGDMLLSQIRTVLVQVCLFAAPYIVYRSQRDWVESPVDAPSGPELMESGS